MKYLALEGLDDVNSFFQHITQDDGSKLLGRIEGYSCKSTSDDKKLRKHLQERYGGSESSLKNLIDSHCGAGGAGNGSGYDSAEDSYSSNSGNGTSNNSTILYSQGIKQLSYLISTMNLVFPDYEFSHVSPDLFIKISSIERLKGDVYMMLWNSGSISKNTEIFSEFITQLWSAIDASIGGLEDCEVWSFMPSDNDDNIEDPFRERGTIWSFNYFIWNRKEKRLLLFYCRCISVMEGEDSFLVDGISFQPRSLTPLN